MPTAYKTLGQQAPTATTPTTLYTVPALTSSVCSTLIICNMGVSTTFRVSVRPAGAVQENKHYLFYEIPVSQYDSVPLTLGITLAATDVVTVYAGTATVAFSLFGSELT